MAATRKTLLAALAAILPSLAAAQGALAARAEAVTITPYGFILAAGFLSDTKFGTATTSQQDYPSFAYGGPGSTFFSARQTRIGVRLDFPDALGATVKGVVEADFKGGYAGATSNAQAYVPLPRLRIAWIAATWEGAGGHVGVGAGQEYGLVNPLFATSSAWVADPIFYDAGNLWRRSTQLRVFGDVALPSGLGVGWAAAVLDPIDSVPDAAPDYGPGNVSREPDLEARVAVSWRQAKQLVAEVGVGGWYGKERFYPAGAASQTVTKRLVGVDAQVNLPVPVVPITLKGEWFTGSDLDTYWGDLGTGVVGAPAAPVGVASTGFWAQAVLQPLALVQLVGGYGMEDPSDAHLADGARSENQMIQAGVIVTPARFWRVGVEWAQTRTSYENAGSRTGNQLAISTALTF